jgi:flagellar biosynthetic protein FliR
MRRDSVFLYVLDAGSNLFAQSLILAFPILGTLFLISVVTGLLSRAAPQMNLLTEGFPVSISVAFLLLFASLPFMAEAFSRIIGAGFDGLSRLMAGAPP